MSLFNGVNGHLINKKIKVFAASAALLSTASAFAADTEKSVDTIELGPVYNQSENTTHEHNLSYLEKYLGTNLTPTLPVKENKTETTPAEVTSSIPKAATEDDIWYNHDKWSDADILGDHHSITTKQKRYRSREDYRNSVKSLYTRQVEEGIITELGDPIYALTLWHAHIDPKMSKYMAMGVSGAALSNPDQPYLNMNMQTVVDCRDDFYQNNDASQYSAYQVFLHVHGCAKDQIETAFEPFKDNTISHQAGRVINVELDSAPLGVAISKYKNDGQYKEAVSTWSQQLFNAKETDGMKAENYVPMMAAVLNTSITWKDFQGYKDNNASSFNEFSLRDPYAPYLNRNMEILFECRDKIIPADGVIESRRETFDEIMDCWRTEVQDNYAQTTALLEADPSNILLDTASDLQTKIYRMDKDYSGYAPYQNAVIAFGAPMEDAGFVSTDISTTSFVRFMEAHTNPNLKPDELDDHGSIEKSTPSSEYLHKNISLVTQARDEILAGKEPVAIEDLKAAFKQVQEAALNRLEPVNEHYTKMDQDEFLDSDTTLEQFQLIKRALLDPSVTAEDFNAAGLGEDSAFFGGINDNFSAILEAREEIIGDTTLSDNEKSDKIYKRAGEIAESSNDWILPSIGTAFALAIFGPPLLSAASSGVSAVGRSRRRRKEENTRLHNN